MINHWPFPYSARNTQQLAFEWLEQNRDKKYLILELPVGAGKSNIGITLSRAIAEGAGDSYILTPQRILQEQYEDSMKDITSIRLASLYGKSNYKCEKGDYSCEIGSLLAPRCGNCPHKLAKQNAVSAANTVLNYQLALTSWAFTETFNPRNLIVCDECHTLEQYLVNFDAVDITSARSKKWNVPFMKQHDMMSALEWIEEYYLTALEPVVTQCHEEIDEIEKYMDSGISQQQIKRYRDCSALLEHHTNVDQLLNNENILDEYVLVHDDIMFQFKRVTGASAFKRYIEPNAKQVLFMSSTVLNKDGFCSDLGLDPNQTAFLSLPSEFPVENRPIFYAPTMKVNAGWKRDEAGKKQLLQGVEDICEAHDGETGVIHTGNYALAEWLVDNLDVKQKIFHHNPSSGDDRNRIIKAYMAYTKPSILISPSCTEGLDLKEDLGRFAIFAKVPYGFLGDQWIKRRMEMSGEWYARQALIAMIQGGGRVVRSETDEGSVYILDACFAFLYNKNRYMVPKWWQESYQRL